MTSSTSSSKKLPSSKKTALWLAVISLVLLAPAVLTVNAITQGLEAKVGDIFGIQRIRSVAESTDYMAQTSGDTVLVFGSSLVNEGFSPRYFDQRAESRLQHDITSYNIGMGNMKPAYQLLLAKRLREAHERNNKRAHLSVIELTPFLLTKRRNAFRPYMNEQVTAVFMSEHELWAQAWEDPDRFARLFSIRHLRDGVSAEAITGGLRLLLNAAQAQAPVISSLPAEEIARLEEQRQLLTKMRHQIASEQPQTGKSHVWNPATQGSPVDMMDLSPETQALVVTVTEKMRNPNNLKRDLQERVDCCDIIELDFDDSMVEEFIAIVEEFKQFSDHVELVIFPAPPSLIQPSDDTMARQQSVVQRIVNRTGASVRDYQFDSTFDDSHFYDATHLSMDKGRIVFSQRLADDLITQLR